MPHQNIHSSKATAQNAVTDPVGPNDQAREQHASVRPEPHSYAAPDLSDSTVAPPAAGEIADFMDEGDPLGADDVQLGSTNRNRPRNTDADTGQGPRTREANRRIAQTGSADGR